MTTSNDEFTGKYERTGRAGTLLIDRFYVAVRQLLEPVIASGDVMMEIGCGAAP